MWKSKSASSCDNNIPRPRGAPNCLQNLIIVRTGELTTMTDKQFVTYVQTFGGKSTSAVSGKTSYLLQGQDPGEVKKRTAKEKNVPIINEEEFFQLVRDLSYMLTKKQSEEVNYANSIIFPEKQSEEKIEVSTPIHRDPLMWTIKYKPMQLTDIIGNNSIIQDIKSSLNSQGNLFLIGGPPGTGKSSIVNILSQNKNFNFIYSNSDEPRTGKLIQALISKFITHTVTNQQNILIFDDAESIEAYGIPEIIKSSEKYSNLKFYLISQDINNMKFKSLKSKATIFKLKRPQKQIIAKFLTNIMKNENIQGNLESIAEIVSESASGDIRRCLNSIQFSSAGKLSIQPNDVKMYLQQSTSLPEKTDMFFNAKRTRNQSPDFFTDLQQYYYRESLFYPSLVQNYQIFTDHNLEFATFASEKLSEIDNISFKQFNLSDWSGSKSAVLKVQELALQLIVSDCKAGGFTLPQFPGIISVKKAGGEGDLLCRKFGKFRISAQEIDLVDVILASQFREYNNVNNFQQDFDFTEMENIVQRFESQLKSSECKKMVSSCLEVVKVGKQKKMR